MCGSHSPERGDSRFAAPRVHMLCRIACLSTTGVAVLVALCFLLRPFASIVHLSESIDAHGSLWQAVLQNDVSKAKQLIANGADVNGQQNRMTLLHLAARDGTPEMLLQLLSAGADANALGAKDKCAPLAIAAAKGDAAAVRALLDSGALIDSTDIFNRTALVYAAMNGRTTVAKLLLEAGADREIRSDIRTRRQTARDIAYERGHMGVVRLLDRGQIEKGGDTNVGLRGQALNGE